MTSEIYYWNEQAATFDESADHGLRDPATRRAWASLLLPRLPAAPARVADMGCGTGSLSVLIAEAGHRVSGIDSAARMITAAQAKAATAGVEVVFDLGDASAPPWRAGTFDVVICRHVVWALSDPERALADWAGLLVPGGRLLLIEGRWSTGAGISAEELLGLLPATLESAEVVCLDDPELWGGRIYDQRYLLSASSSAAIL